MRRQAASCLAKLTGTVILAVIIMQGCDDTSNYTMLRTINLGRVESGIIIEREVQFNDTGSGLTTANIESDCSCTAVLLNEVDGDVSPRSIIVRIDTAGLLGDFRRQIRVTPASPKNVSHTITFVGHAFRVGPYFATSELKFGDVDIRRAHSVEVKLLNPESEANGDWRVTAVVDDTPGVHAEYRAGRGLECTVEQGMSIGRHIGRITVEYQLNGSNDLADVRTSVLPFSLKAYHAVRIKPDAYYLGASDVDSLTEVMLDLVGDVAMLPIYFTDDRGGIWHVEAGNEADSARLVGQIQTPARPGPFAGALSLVADHSELPFTVAYSGIAMNRSRP